MAAVVDCWLDLFDDDSLAAFEWLHACGDSFVFDAASAYVFMIIRSCADGEDWGPWAALL